MSISLLAEEQQILEQLSSKVNHAFVTGAGGFLGKAITLRLQAAGIKVTGFARGHYPELEKIGVNMIRGDIADQQQVLAAMEGCDIVFHVAAKAGVWGDRDSYFKPNVEGSANIIAACKQLAIDKLVFTSSPSITFEGKDEDGIDESVPYANEFLTFYSHSKSISERMILDANSQSLKTVALRPHLIWGPGDPNLIPRVLSRAKAGKLKLVGSKDKLVDTIYIDNAAYAHFLAAVDLTNEYSKSAGKAYFLSNDEPITMKALLNQILACDGLPAVNARVPAKLAYVVGFVMEAVYKLLNKQQEPMMTRFIAKQLSCSHYYDISAAKRDLNYKPLISIKEGMQRLKKSL
ncbi:MAG: 2-alkyl-3-oxoalkanoate reductase [Parashewanella sp.]